MLTLASPLLNLIAFVSAPPLNVKTSIPVSSKKAIRAIYESDGLAETVSDEEILAAQKLLARTEGIGVEPASAASIAGLIKLVEAGKIDKGEQIVCVVTGHVLKDPNVAINACEEPIEIEPDIKSILKIIKGE